MTVNYVQYVKAHPLQAMQAQRGLGEVCNSVFIYAEIAVTFQGISTLH
jgi:hypothetical protein